MSEFVLSAYLDRIGLEGQVDTSAEGLESLHRAHGCTVPYENFDVLLGRDGSLAPGDLFDKIVTRGRGGYCFEQNELFFAALTALGFTARRVLSRLHVSAFPATRIHEMLLVDIDDEKWLADVGCGSLGLRAPIRCVLYEPAEQEGEWYRLKEASSLGTMLQGKHRGEWTDIASFDLTPVTEPDLVMSNYYASTNRSLIYSQVRIATLNRPEGRIALADFKLSETSRGKSEKTELKDDPTYLETLQEMFGIELDVSYEDLTRGWRSG